MAASLPPSDACVFSELVAPDRLIAGATLEHLARRNLALQVAITPEVRTRAVDIVRACRDAGVAVGVWPMIDDARGRWASAWTGVAFADYTRALLDVLDAAGALPDQLLVDLEPPIGLTRAVLRGRPPLAGPPPRVGAGALRTLVDEIDRSGLPVTAAAHPWTVSGAGSRGWQRAFGTPIDGLPFRRVYVMAYTSLIEGYSRGLYRRRDAEALLARWTADAGERLGDAAGIALGVIGVGALGDERRYRTPAELARDVAIARAAGARHLALFNLGGALDRPPVAAWLDALAAAPAPLGGPPSLRVRLATGGASAAGRALARALARRR